MNHRLNRRTFLAETAAAWWAGASARAEEMRATSRIRALTSGPKHHFYGYYGVSPWDRAMRYHLALETDFHNRPPTAADKARVGLADARTGAFAACAETAAFNFQQGSMLHWIDAGRGEEFTFNDWEGDRLVSRAVHPETKARRTLEFAIEAVSPREPIALGLNYGRMSLCRPVVGYALPKPPGELVPYPEDDGLFRVDLATGKGRLVLSIKEVIAALPADETRIGPAYFNHIDFSTDGGRVLFLCRIKKPDGGFLSSLWTVDPDGKNPACQIDYRHKVSHFVWLAPRHLLITTDVLGRMGFVEFTDGQKDFKAVGAGVLPGDGHPALSPDRRWIACDSYAGGRDPERELMLFRMADGRKVSLGRFASPEPYSGDIRCDLHPRWSPDARLVSFDSIHEGLRQIYLADVADIVSA